MSTIIRQLTAVVTAQTAQYDAAMTRVEGRAAAAAAKIRMAGMVMGGIFAVVGIASIKMAADFERSMANVNTLLGGNSKRIKELGDDVKRMARDTGKGLDDLTGGLYQVISAFGDSADSVKILDITAKAAVAGLATTTEALNLISAVTKGYGDTSAEAAQKAADLAFETVRLGQTTFPELAASIGRVIPLAAKMGVTVEEVNAIFATLTGVTGNAAEVSTQAAGMLRAFIKPTKDMKEAIKELGYEGSEALLGSLGLVPAMKALVATTDGSVEATGKLFRRTEAMTGLFALTGGQADVFAMKLEAMGEASGSATRAFEVQADTFHHRLDRLIQDISTGLVDLGTTLLPMAENVLGWANNVARLAGEIAKLFEGVGKAAEDWVPQWLKDAWEGGVVAFDWLKGFDPTSIMNQVSGARMDAILAGAARGGGPPAGISGGAHGTASMFDRMFPQNAALQMENLLKAGVSQAEALNRVYGDLGKAAMERLKTEEALALQVEIQNVAYRERVRLLAEEYRAGERAAMKRFDIEALRAAMLDEAVKYESRIAEEIAFAVENSRDLLGLWGKLSTAAETTLGGLESVFDFSEVEREWAEITAPSLGDEMGKAFTEGFKSAMHNINDIWNAVVIGFGDAFSVALSKSLGDSFWGSIASSIGGSLISSAFSWIGGLFSGGGTDFAAESQARYEEQMEALAEAARQAAEALTAAIQTIKDTNYSIYQTKEGLDNLRDSLHAAREAERDAARTIRRTGTKFMIIRGERDLEAGADYGVEEEISLTGGPALKHLQRLIDEAIGTGKYGRISRREKKEILAQVVGEENEQLAEILIEAAATVAALDATFTLQKEQLGVLRRTRSIALKTRDDLQSVEAAIVKSGDKVVDSIYWLGDQIRPLQSGGDISQTGLYQLHAGERVFNARDTAQMDRGEFNISRGAGPTTINLVVDGRTIATAVLPGLEDKIHGRQSYIMSDAIRRRGVK